MNFLTEDATDELEALSSILDKDFSFTTETQGGASTTLCKLRIVPTEKIDEAVEMCLSLVLVLPSEYPLETCMVTVERGNGVKREALEELEKELQAKANECAVDKMVAIFEIQQLGLDWVTKKATEFLAQKEQVKDLLETEQRELATAAETSRISASMAAKKSKELEAIYAERMRKWMHGGTAVDRKSVFQAHLAEVHSADEAHEAMNILYTDNKIARATHNIWSFRVVKDNGVMICDNDDDGEKAAGGRLMHLLDMMNVKNVCVVVSRWYGGILLGPVRFKHINNVARELLENHGYDTRKGPGKAGNSGGKGVQKGKGSTAIRAHKKS